MSYVMHHEDMPYYIEWCKKEAGLTYQQEMLEQALSEGWAVDWVEGQRRHVERCEREAKAAKAVLMERMRIDE